MAPNNTDLSACNAEELSTHGPQEDTEAAVKVWNSLIIKAVVDLYVSYGVRRHTYKWRPPPEMRASIRKLVGLYGGFKRNLEITETILVEENKYSVRNHKYCAICLEEFTMGEPVKRTNCADIFHVSCIDTWLKYKKTCPCCQNAHLEPTYYI